MKGKVLLVLFVAVIVLLLTGCGCPLAAGESAMPMPVPPVELPYIALPEFDVPVAPLELPIPVAVPLPGVHDRVVYQDHAVERHGSDAERVRRAGEDPRSDCRLYRCGFEPITLFGSNSVVETYEWTRPDTLMRVCSLSDPRVVGIQWLWHSVLLDAWIEGTSFVKSTDDVRDYLMNQGCLEAQ